MRIKGKVSFQSIGPGFWGIVDDQGKEWRPVNMPEQLKYEGAKVELSASSVQEEMSIFMWGTPIRIRSFETLEP